MIVHILNAFAFVNIVNDQSGQITSSGTCTRSGTVVPDLVIFFSFMLYGHLNIFWRSILTQMFIEPCNEVQTIGEF